MSKTTKISGDAVHFLGEQGTADNTIESESPGVLSLSGGASELGDMQVWDYNVNGAAHGIKVYPDGAGFAVHVFIDEHGAHTAAISAMAGHTQTVEFIVGSVTIAEYDGTWQYHSDSHYFIGIYGSQLSSWHTDPSSPLAQATDVGSLAQMLSSQSGNGGLIVSFPIATDVRLTGLAAPSDASDATNKEYVDSRLVDLSAGVTTSGPIVCNDTATASGGPTFAAATGALKIEGGVYVHADVVVNGQVTASEVQAHSLTSLSDERLKKDIQPLEAARAIALCRSLRSVEYRWKASGKRDVGFIAQEVQQVIPELVHMSEAGVMSVEYGKLVAVLLVAINDIFDRLP